MKNSMFLNTCGMVAMALCMTLNVACSESKQSAGVQGNPSPVAGSQFDGTADGNGGNGINGKMYESYIVDPTTLPAYKNLIQPKLEMLLKKAEKEQGTLDEAVSQGYAKMFISKKWYLAPVSLNTLNKKTIGVEFTKENTEQLALQTKNEVWINSKIFEKMSEKDQATLLAHEFTMSARMEIKKGHRHICELLAGKGCEYFENDRIGTDEMNQEDYQKIRAATAYVMSIDENTALKSMQDVFVEFFFGDFMESTKWKEVAHDVTVSSSTLKTILKRASLSGKLNGLCFDKPCRIDIREQGESLMLTVVDAETSKEIRSFTMNIYDQNSVRKMAKEGTDWIVYSVNMYDLFSSETLKDGSITNMITVHMSDLGGVTPVSDVKAIQLDQYIWTVTESKDSNGKPCRNSVGTPIQENKIFMGEKSLNMPASLFTSETCPNN